MQELAEKSSALSQPDHARIRQLVDAAAKKSGDFNKLAHTMGVTPQLVSNWRNGVKVPSPEAQTELATIAGQNPFIASLMALIEKTHGTRKARLQDVYREWMKAGSPTLGPWRNS